MRRVGQLPAAGLQVRGVPCMCVQACVSEPVLRLRRSPAHLPWVCTRGACTFHPESEPPPRLGAEKAPQSLPHLRLTLPWTQGSKVCRPHLSRPSPAPAGSSPLPWILSVTRVRNPARQAQRLGRNLCHCRSRTSGPHGRGGRNRLSRISGCLVVLTLESAGPQPHCWVRTRAPPLSYGGSLAGSPKPRSLSFPICETGTVTAPAEFRVERFTGPLEGRGLPAPSAVGHTCLFCRHLSACGPSPSPLASVCRGTDLRASGLVPSRGPGQRCPGLDLPAFARHGLPGQAEGVRGSVREARKKAWRQVFKRKKVEVAQSCLILCDPMDYKTVQGILQARILECVAGSLLQGIFLTQKSNPGLPHPGRFFEPPGKPGYLKTTLHIGCSEKFQLRRFQACT